MKKFLDELDKKQFLSLSIILGAFSDAVLLGYLYVRFSNRDIFNLIIDQMKKADPQVKQALAPEYVEQLFMLMINSLILMLVFVAILHIIIYFLYSRESKFATHYLKLYSYCAIPGFALLGLSSFSISPLWSVGFFIGIVGYVLFIKGINQKLVK
ncbi:hypothetical protein OAT67_07790 [Bacteriovoracaceae bacterium]|nr:hypothetical protein [Bacteriovoracaceae bacterium]